MSILRSAVTRWRERVSGLAVDAEVVAAAAVLGAVLVVGLATAADYGLTVDEFNTDDYGPKALAWYTSGFKDRSHFETVEFSLWYYGPWFHMLTAYLQSFDWAGPDHGPARDDVPRRPRRGGGAAAARAHCDRPLGRACRRRALPDDGVSLRQPVRHADRRSVSRRDDVGDARHRADDAPHAAVMAGHRRCRSAHRIGHRHTHRRYHHPCLSVRSHAPVRRGILDPAWLAAALSSADRRALRGRRRPRLGHGDRALAMAADRQSVGAVQGRAGALCDHPDVV